MFWLILKLVSSKFSFWISRRTTTFKEKSYSIPCCLFLNKRFSKSFMFHVFRRFLWERNVGDFSDGSEFVSLNLYPVWCDLFLRDEGRIGNKGGALFCLFRCAIISSTRVWRELLGTNRRGDLVDIHRRWMCTLWGPLSATTNDIDSFDFCWMFVLEQGSCGCLVLRMKEE
jgi:hypothetical protein